jgi:hypothetical protein
VQATADDAEVSRIRDAFARLGTALVERMHFESRLEAAQRDIDRLDQAARAAEARAASQCASLEEASRRRDETRRAEIEEQRGLIAGLQHEIVRLGQLREAERVEWQRQCAISVQASEEADGLRAAVTALLQSRSVRLTRPLRAAGGWCRALVAWTRGDGR